jgi:hypothetical protein
MFIRHAISSSNLQVTNDYPYTILQSCGSWQIGLWSFSYLTLFYLQNITLNELELSQPRFKLDIFQIKAENVIIIPTCLVTVYGGTT